MKNITLLPASYRKKVAEQQKTARVISVLQICVLVVVVVCLGMFQMRNTFVSQQQAATQEIQQIETQIASYDQAIAMSERVAQQRDLQTQAQGDVPDLDAIIVTVSNSAPTLVQVTAMAMAYENGQGAGVISGRAGAYDDVSQWIDILQDNPNLDNVRCSYTQQSSDATAGVTFELQFLVLADS